MCPEISLKINKILKTKATLAKPVIVLHRCFVPTILSEFAKVRAVRPLRG